MIEIRTLTDGGQTALQIADEIAAFLAESRRSLDIALYDIRVDGAEEAPLDRSPARGTRPRGAGQDSVQHLPPRPDPRPGAADARSGSTCGAAVRNEGNTGRPRSHASQVRNSGRRERPDGLDRTGQRTRGADKRTCSRPWPRRRWQPPTVGTSRSSGRSPSLPTRATTTPTPSMSAEPRREPGSRPGEEPPWPYRIAHKLDRGTRPNPHLLAGHHVGADTRNARTGRHRPGVDAAGVVDATQIAQVITQWRANGNAAWKIPLLQTAMDRVTSRESARRRGGRATIHDFMHAKVTVTDNTVFLGSFNLSLLG